MIDGVGITKHDGMFQPIMALGEIVFEEAFTYKLMNGIEATVHPETRLLVWSDEGPVPKFVHKLNFDDKVMIKMWEPRCYKTMVSDKVFCFEDLGRMNTYEERRNLAITEGQSLGLMNAFSKAGENRFQKFLANNREASFSKQGYILMSEIQQIGYSLFGLTIHINEHPNGFRYSVREFTYFCDKHGFFFIPVVSLTKHCYKRHLTQIDSVKLVTSNGIFLQR